MTLVSALILAFLVGVVVFILLVRFCKRPFAAFHRVVTNPIASKVTGRLPGFGIIVNVGRKSGRIYRTPVNVFRQPKGFLIALTYGRDSGWVANIMAASCCELETRGVTYPLVLGALVSDPQRRRFPGVVRVVLGLMDANDYLELQLRDDRTEAQSIPGTNLA
jgi:deazaflavin-dependent oxidoreductase (nitroreductase family)